LNEAAIAKLWLHRGVSVSAYVAPVTKSSYATSRSPAGLFEFMVAAGYLSGSRVAHWFLRHERGISHECGPLTRGWAVSEDCHQKSRISWLLPADSYSPTISDKKSAETYTDDLSINLPT